MSDESSLTTDLAVDAPVSLDGNFKAGAHDRRRVDNQILASQRHLVESLLSGCHATWFRLDANSADVVAGDCVCAASVASSDGIPIVTKAVSAALTNAKSVAGVVLVATAHGSR